MKLLFPALLGYTFKLRLNLTWTWLQSIISLRFTEIFHSNIYLQANLRIIREILKHFLNGFDPNSIRLRIANPQNVL